MSPLIILAGGKSSRMTEPKGLVKNGAEVWLETQLKNFKKAGGTRAIVVLGFEKEKFLNELSFLGSTINWNGLVVETSINMNPERGQFSSILEGLKLTKRAFILPVDVPAADSEIWQKLERAMTGGVLACMPIHEGKGGHPVLLHENLVQKLLQLSPERGRLDEVLHSLKPNELQKIPVADSKIEMNLNQPSDWERFQKS